MRFLHTVGISVLGLSFAYKSDQKLQELKYDDIAVVSGDFDHMAEMLVRMDVNHTEFEGYIEQAIYDETIDPDINSLKVEGLFHGENEDGVATIMNYDAVFINSGTRGLGSYVYNGIEADSALIEDPKTKENVLAYVEGGGLIFASDWAADLIEHVWPEKLQLANEASCDEDLCLDVAQSGVSESVLATVSDPDLALELDNDTLDLSFDYTYWTVIESVSNDVTIFLEGDVEYRPSNAEAPIPLSKAPLLIGFEHGRGQVFFSSFHWRAQNPAVADALMLGIVEGLSPGNNADVE
jgi:hypothetical protein